MPTEKLRVTFYAEDAVANFLTRFDSGFRTKLINRMLRYAMDHGPLDQFTQQSRLMAWDVFAGLPKGINTEQVYLPPNTAAELQAEALDNLSRDLGKVLNPEIVNALLGARNITEKEMLKVEQNQISTDKAIIDLVMSQQKLVDQHRAAIDMCERRIKLLEKEIKLLKLTKQDKHS